MKKTRETSRSEKFEARAPDGHHRDYILLLFVRLVCKSTLICFSFFFFNDSRIASHSPFACKWQNRFSDSEPVTVRFSSNKDGTSDIQIPRNSSKLHPAPCIHDVCCVHRLGPSYTSKQNVLFLILLILLTKLTNQKRDICRHLILYPLQLGPPFPNDA